MNFSLFFFFFPNWVEAETWPTSSWLENCLGEIWIKKSFPQVKCLAWITSWVAAGLPNPRIEKPDIWKFAGYLPKINHKSTKESWKSGRIPPDIRCPDIRFSTFSTCWGPKPNKLSKPDISYEKNFFVPDNFQVDVDVMVGFMSYPKQGKS